MLQVYDDIICTLSQLITLLQTDASGWHGTSLQYYPIFLSEHILSPSATPPAIQGVIIVSLADEKYLAAWGGKITNQCCEICFKIAHRFVTRLVRPHRELLNIRWPLT